MAVAPAYIYDNFTRVTNSGDLGFTDTGQQWLTQHSTDFVDGTAMKLTVSAGQAHRLRIIRKPNGSGDLRQVLMLCSWGGTDVTYPQTDHGPAICVQNEYNYVYGGLVGGTNPAVIIGAYVSGTYRELARVPTTISKGKRYWTRLALDEVRVRGETAMQPAIVFKVWGEGEVEPTSWTATYLIQDTDNYAPLSVGYHTHGLFDTYTVWVRNYVVYADGYTEPGLPVEDTFARSSNTGLGISTSRHAWEGHFARDPAVADGYIGSIVQSNGYAVVAPNDTTHDHVGFIGPSVTNTTDTTVSFLLASGTPSGTGIDIGVRGTAYYDSGHLKATGYVVRFRVDQATALVMKRGSPTETNWTTFASLPVGFTIVANTRYWAKVRVQTTNGNTVIQFRAWANGTTEPTTWSTTYTDTTNPITSGRAFIRFEHTSGSTLSHRLYFVRSEDSGAGNQTIVGVPYAYSRSDTAVTVAYPYTGDDNNNNDASINNTYHRVVPNGAWINSTSATISPDRTNKRWLITYPGLTPGTNYQFRTAIYDADGFGGGSFVFTDTGTIATTNNRLVMSANSWSVSGVDVDRATITVTYAGDDNANAVFYVYAKKSTEGAYYLRGTMTRDPQASPRAMRYTITGLEPGTIYNIYVNATDADGVTRANGTQASNETIFFNIETLGKAIEFVSLSATGQQTTALVEADYRYDTNNNATCTFQYRSIFDSVWINVSPADVTKNASQTSFLAILRGLRPGTTYEAKATVSDPDGMYLGAPNVRTVTFVTKGGPLENPRKDKKYVWKIYSPDGSYVGTWPDAGVPEFGYSVNGGVSDMRVRLNRRISDLTKDGTIRLENRVDVWAVYPHGDGFDANMLDDNGIQDGRWTLASPWQATDHDGPDGLWGLRAINAPANAITIRSQPVDAVDGLKPGIPMVVAVRARAQGGKLRVYIEAYNATDQVIDQSDDYAETVGTEWQELRFEYTAQEGTAYIRICAENIGAGHYYMDDPTLKRKESLIYRGRIETYSPTIKQNEQYVEIEILGEISRLSDDYVEFLQYAAIQPSRDLGKPKREPTDPAQMLRDIIDIARKNNPRCTLYYTPDSINNTGQIMEYTFRDQQLRACLDKLRTLCPPGWHYFIDPDGLVHLRGPEHTRTHLLKLGVEIMNFEMDVTIRNLKNFIHVKGREDEDKSESDGYGTIVHDAFDQESIDKYGLRKLYVRDANIITPEDAEIVAEGRLEEYNREEQSTVIYVPDDKSLMGEQQGALRGYNIESFRPGDMVQVIDPETGERWTYWDFFRWDEDLWDNSIYDVHPVSTPIVKISYYGDHATIELSERQPSSSGDYGKLVRYLALQDSKNQ